MIPFSHFFPVVLFGGYLYSFFSFCFFLFFSFLFKKIILKKILREALWWNFRQEVRKMCFGRDSHPQISVGRCCEAYFGERVSLSIDVLGDGAYLCCPK